VTPKGGGKAKGGAGAQRAAPSTPLVQRLTERVDQGRLPYRVAIGGAGALASAYLTILHFTTSAALGCPEGKLINCSAVLTSPQSSIFGIPVAAFGLVFFLGYLASVYARTRLSSPRQSQFGLVWSLGGAVAVLALVYVELFVVHYVCLWCSFTHLMALSLFVLELWPTVATDDLRADERRRARQTAARPHPRPAHH
jgi:uncharacterized membrane protein